MRLSKNFRLFHNKYRFFIEVQRRICGKVGKKVAMLIHLAVVKLLIVLAAMVLVFPALPAYCNDIYVINRPHTKRDKRLDYSYELLRLALKESQSEFGPFELSRSSFQMYRDRQFKELMRGKYLNVMVSPPKPGWEGHATRVKFPIQKGIASFRMAILLEENRDLLKNVSSLGELKNYTVGVNNQWSTTLILRHHNFNVVAGESYLSLFHLLSARRFQVFPRGLNEIYAEIDVFTKKFPNLIVDEHTAVIMYLPSYYYTYPKKPVLAKRLEYGLKKLYASGGYEVFFQQHFSEILKKAKLNQRKIFYLDNPNLGASMLQEDKPYLLKAFQEIIEKQGGINNNAHKK